MIYGTAQLLDPRIVVATCTGGTVSKAPFPFPPSFLLSFFLSLSRIAPLVFFPPFSLRRWCHCSCVTLPVPCLVLLLSLFRSSVTRKRTLIAWHSAQTNTSGHRSEERERRGQHRRRRRQRADRASERASGRDASSYGTDDDDRRIGWKEGRKEGIGSVEGRRPRPLPDLIRAAGVGRSGESTFAPRACSSAKKYVQEYIPPTEARRGGEGSRLSSLPCRPACATLLRSSHISCMYLLTCTAELS